MKVSPWKTTDQLDAVAEGFEALVVRQLTLVAEQAVLTLTEPVIASVDLDTRTGDLMRRVLAHTLIAVEPVTPPEMAEALGVEVDTVGRYLRRGVDRGLLSRVERGRFEPAEVLTAATAVSDDLSQIPQIWLDVLDKTLLPEIAALFVQAANGQVEELIRILPPEVTSALPTLTISSATDSAIRYIEQARARWTLVGQDLWRAVRDQLAEGMKLGEGIPELARRIRAATGLTEAQARVVARTEVVAASNAGSIQAIRSAPLQEFELATGKEWIATHDDRTRETHLAADTQVVPLQETFTVGGAPLDFPGDPSGPANEVINCRCTIGYEVLTAEEFEAQVLATLTAADHPSFEDVGMVALIPTAEDAERLAVFGTDVGGVEAGTLHATLFYLGEIDQFTPEVRAGLIELIREAVEGRGLIEADGFSVAAFNPNHMERSTALVLGLSGESLEIIHHTVVETIMGGVGGYPLAAQFRPWIPHVTIAYNNDNLSILAELAVQTGPIVFDRVRVVFGEEAVDIPLGDTMSTSAQRGVDSMPWYIERGFADCPAAQPWGVVKAGDDSLAGCHVDKQGALDQLAALNIAEQEEGTAAAVEPQEQEVCPEGEHRMPDGSCMPDSEMAGELVGFRSVAIVEDEWTGDGRRFAAGSITWPEPTGVLIPLEWQKETSHGGVHDVTVTVGRISEVERDGNRVIVRGVMDVGKPDGVEAVRQIGEKFLRGVSIVGDDPENSDVEIMFGPDEEPIGYVYHGARIRSLTLCNVPAFVEGQLELVYGEEAQRLAGIGLDPVLTAAGYTIEMPELPPGEWFAEPAEEPEIGAITVTDAGRLFGYLAPANVSHRSFKDRKVVVPMDRVDYSGWMTRPTQTTSGTLATGVITMDCGHAPVHPGIPGAVRKEHYDDSCSVVATARVGENARGVWIAGAILPWATAEQVGRFMACQLSGDWQPHPDKPGIREFISAHTVPVPGFAKATSQRRLRMDEGALVAAHVPIRYVDQRSARLAELTATVHGG